MPSLVTFFLTALAATAVVASGPTTNFSDIPAIVKEIGPTTAASWCNAQQATCGAACSGLTDFNNCDPPTLDWNCTCSSNHSAPALEYYIGSVINNECHQSLGDCLKNHAGDLAGQKACPNTFVCSDLNATLAAQAAASSTAPPSSTPTATGAASTAASGAPSATPTHASANALRFGEQYGIGLLAAGVVGVMGFAL